jgi:hypothetical protein
MFDQEDYARFINDEISMLKDELKRGKLEKELTEELNQWVFSK